MTKTKSTKRALLMSAFALLICVSMLIGSTFAWFTDSVTSTGNIIKSGTLDVEMYWAEGTEELDSANWKDASEGAIFNYDLWEPGYVEVRHIKIANEGTLALKYQIKIMANGEVSDLSDVIDVYYLDPAQQIADRTQLIEDNKLGTLTNVLKGLDTTASGELAANTADTITLALKMQESAGNEYQGKSIGSDFSVILMATQLTAEEDSFDDQYDKDATFLNKDKDGNWLISNAAELVYFGATVNSGKNYKNETVKLTADIDLAGYNWKPAGNLVSYPGITFAGEFDGQGHTIANMNTTDTTANHASAGFFGSTVGAKIHDVTFKNATVTSTHYAGVVVGYEGANSSTTVIENVVIDGAKVTTAAELINGEWDNGDKAGGIAGYSTSMTITGCTVKNSTIIGYRDIGGIIGYADAYPATTVTGNTVENTVVKCDITHNYKNYTADDEYDIEAVAGEQDVDSVVNNNTVTNVKVIVPVIVTNATDLADTLANAKAGTVINLKEDTSYGTVTVDELKDVVINGAEGTTVIFKTDASTKLEDVTLTNFGFEYTGATYDCGIVIDANAQIDNLVVDGCTVTGDGSKAGRGLSGANNNATIVLKNCTFKDLGYPVYAWGGYEALTIEGCTFDNIKSWAIMPQGGFDGDLTVTGCTFKNCLGGGLIKAGTLTAGHTFTFTNNTVTGCTIAGDHNWFQFNVSAGTTVISGNTMDGDPWTPGTADGLK